MNDEKVNDIFNNWWKATGCQLLSLEWDAKYIAGSAYVEAFNRAQLRHATDTQAIKLLTAVRDAYTISGKFPPVELVLHTVNEALKALNHDATEVVTASVETLCRCSHDVYEDILKPGYCTACGKVLKQPLDR